MRKIDEYILDAAKLVYGFDKVEADLTLPVGYETVYAWYLLGFETVKDLEAKYSDDEILEMYYLVQQQLRKMAS